jgi:preprotein translocase subunit SecD
MTPLQEKVRIGLDLQGGMHVVLGVDTDAAVDAKLDSVVVQLRSELQRENIPFTYVQRSGMTINIGMEEGASTSAIANVLSAYQLDSVSSSDNSVLSYALSQAEVTRLKDSAVLQSLEVVRNRIDQFGVAEPLIQRQGTDQVLVQLPGITDPDRAINLIGQTAQLRFFIVDNTVTEAQLTSGMVPYDSIIMQHRVLDDTTGRVISTTPYALKREPVLTGENLLDAYVTYNEYNQPQVGFEFDRVGARIFSDVTAENVGRQLAIVLDDNVYSAPSINERIPGGRGVITGQYTMEEANDLAVVLRAGSLPAPVEILENRTVGPSLGQDSIESGVKACIMGLIFIMLFMLIYYRLSGMIANFGLVCNFIVLLGALCFLQATLTLPGIAGVILTLGIAVDANVLIFERVREELRQNRTVLNAFEIGYSKAFTTIVDANITSIIAAVVLFQFGTGPVRGFAVTLTLGLLASMFTAVFITRTIFMEYIIRKNPKTISI